MDSKIGTSKVWAEDDCPEVRVSPKKGTKIDRRDMERVGKEQVLKVCDLYEKDLKVSP